MNVVIKLHGGPTSLDGTTMRLPNPGPYVRAIEPAKMNLTFTPTTYDTKDGPKIHSYNFQRIDEWGMYHYKWDPLPGELPPPLPTIVPRKPIDPNLVRNILVDLELHRASRLPKKDDEVN